MEVVIINNLEKPIFPIIILGKYGYLEILHDDSDLSECSLLGFIKGFYKTIACYDKPGNLWGVTDVESKYKKNWPTIFLANTIYNPKIKVKFKWKKEKNYNFDELKNKIIRLLQTDDNILTQFNEKDALIKLINNTNDFDELISNLQKYIFEENYLND